MDAKFRKRMKWVGARRPHLPDDPGRLPRLKLGSVLAGSFVITLAALAVLTWAALTLLHHPKLAQEKTISVHDAIGVAQLVFASVAGAGALVALVVAYRRQRVSEANSVHDRERWQIASAHDRARVLNERFTTIAAQLGDDQAAVRLAGVHAMAGLADDWEENRQTCIDVLCAYLRMPYEPDPGEEAPAAERLAFRSSREVRHTVIRVITAHLREDTAVFWQGLSFDFTGVNFDGGDFSHASFFGRTVRFDHAVFPSGKVSFNDITVGDGTFSFNNARFVGGEVSFDNAQFDGAEVSFKNAEFSDGEVSFDSAIFDAEEMSFVLAVFMGGEVRFDHSAFLGEVSFDGAIFDSPVIFREADFTLGGIDCSGVMSWLRPPTFDWDGTPPATVKLPPAEGGAAEP